MPPDPVEQLVARDDDAGVLEQVREQVELLAGQLDGLARDGDLARLRIDDDVAELEQAGVGRRLGPPQQRLHAGGELSRRERLRHVVVGAELEAGDAVGFLVPRGQHQDRHGRVRADGLADLEAVLPGQADVEDDEAWPPVAEVRERLLARARPLRRV